MDINPRDCWGTPDDFYGLIDREFAPTLDVCAEESNTKCPRAFVGSADRPFDCDWVDPVSEIGRVSWCNPPYSKIGPWVEKAYREAQKGGTVLVLIPNSTGSGWWRDWALKADEIRFLTGRIKFVPPPGLTASQPRGENALLIFRKHYVKTPPPPRVWWWDWRQDLEG